MFAASLPARAQVAQRMSDTLALPATSPTEAAPAARAEGPALPALGDALNEGLSPAGERALGDRIMNDIWRDPSVLEDPALQEYLDAMWTRLVDGARRRGEIAPEIETTFAWQTFLVRDRSINAFALPGGYIGVHLGLIALTASDAELAAVLAHELSHVTQRHIVRMMGMQRQQSLVGLAAMVLGALAASRNPQAAQALVTGGQAVAIQGQLNFSRDMEREADRVGYGVLSTAGYDVSGMAAMFERLARASQLNDDGSFPYLRTHPLTVDRIGEARARAAALAGAARPGLAAGDATRHALMGARARVLMDARALAWQRVLADAEVAGRDGTAAGTDQENLSNGLSRLASLYGGALAALQMRDLPRADALLTGASARLAKLGVEARDSAQRELARLGMEIALTHGEAGRVSAALERLEADTSRTAQLLRHRASLLPHAPPAAQRQAAAALQTLVAASPGDAQAWSLLAQVWSRLGQPLRAVRAEAEAVALRGDIGGAIERLRAGQRMARSQRGLDFVEASVIDTRLKALEAQRRTLAEEDR